MIKHKTTNKCCTCGKECNYDLIDVGEKHFCSESCRAVHENDNIKKLNNSINTCHLIEDNIPAGIVESKRISKFDYLEDKDIQSKIIDFTKENFSSVTLHIPSMRCASCIRPLETLYKINTGITSSTVNFPEKKIKIIFDNSVISLREIVEMLTSLAHEPLISFDSKDKEIKKNAYSKKLYLKTGIAGFCLGNIMLLSFPEYLSGSNIIESNLKTLFNYLNMLLSFPVIFYCASDFFKSAWKGLKKGSVNIDLPVSIGLMALFIRSLIEIIYFNNAGFSDSLAGLVFLLLLGKLFQNKTYAALNFERDYRSYFPLSVTVKTGKIEKSIPVRNLKTGDRIIIRSHEIIPADCILFNGISNINYSFVTGESIPEQKVMGEIVYAGGMHLGSAIELEVIRTVSSSYLTQLWNDDAFKKNADLDLQSAVNSVSKYFTAAILLIAFSSAAYWYDKDMNVALNAFTTVLIIACPCALALTTPFALGNAIRIFGKNKFYLKNTNVIENLAKADSVVFDKTGTITNANELSVQFTGTKLNLCEFAMIKSLTRNSNHPLSKSIHESINMKLSYPVNDYKENLSEGITCIIAGKKVTLGSMNFIMKNLDGEDENILSKEFPVNTFSTNVYLSIDQKIKGYFSFKNIYREGLTEIIDDLSEDYDLSVISGDNDSEKSNLKKLFSFENDDKLLFRQTPSGKLNYIKTLQSKGSNVIMIGDGLNDAGALKQSNSGISVCENTANFTPASDAIIDASVFSKLGSFMKFSKTTMKIIQFSFAISFLYNVIGLYLASQGTFSPLVAAILMPFNSVSIILFVTGATNFYAKKLDLL